MAYECGAKAKDLHSITSPGCWAGPASERSLARRKTVWFGAKCIQALKMECGGSRVAVGEKRPSRKTPYKSISDFAFIALEGAVVVVVLGCPPIRVFSLTRNSPLTLNLG